MKRTKPEVYSITGAPTSRAEDVGQRTKHYLFSMGVRTACVLGAVLVTGPLRWVLLAGAVFLPYFAVVIANTAAKSRSGPGPDAVTPDEAPRLTERPPPSA